MESARLLQPLQWVDTYFFPFRVPQRVLGMAQRPSNIALAAAAAGEL